MIWQGLRPHNGGEVLLIFFAITKGRHSEPLRLQYQESGIHEFIESEAF